MADRTFFETQVAGRTMKAAVRDDGIVFVFHSTARESVSVPADSAILCEIPDGDRPSGLWLCDGGPESPVLDLRRFNMDDLLQIHASFHPRTETRPDLGGFVRSEAWAAFREMLAGHPRLAARYAAGLGSLAEWARKAAQENEAEDSAPGRRAGA